MLNLFKKIAIVCLLFLGVGITSASVAGYQYFEKIDIVGKGKLLREYTDKEYDKYYKEVSKRKFMAWNVHYVNKDMKIKYVSDTLFSYYNNGSTPITYSYTATTKTSMSFDLSVSGSLSVKTQKTTPIFGDGLNASIKIDAKYKQASEFSEKIEFKIIINPQSQLNLYYYGEGLITNGVAARYAFWLQTKKGGFEFFGATTHYQRLEITPV